MTLTSPFGPIELTFYSKTHGVIQPGGPNRFITINGIDYKFVKEFKILQSEWRLVGFTSGGYYSNSNLNLEFKDRSKKGSPTSSAREKLSIWVETEILAKLTNGDFDSELFKGELSNLQIEIGHRKNRIENSQRDIVRYESEIITLQNQFDKLQMKGKL